MNVNICMTETSKGPSPVVCPCYLLAVMLWSSHSVGKLLMCHPKYVFVMKMSKNSSVNLAST